MKLVEIHPEIYISPAAATPNIQSNEEQLFLSFYLHDESLRNPVESSISNVGVDRTIRFHFQQYQKFQFGNYHLNNLNTHPYHDLGMEVNKIYQLEDSDWIEQEMSSENQDLKHIIFTFEESYLEIITKAYSHTTKTEDTLKEELNYIANLL